DRLSRLRELALRAYDHQDVLLEKIVEELQPERSLSRSPFFQVMFALQNDPRETGKLAGLTVDPFDVYSGSAKFDLLLHMREENEQLKGAIEYNTDLFDASTIARLLGHFEVLLKGIVANPDRRISDLPLLTEAERHQLLVEWNDTKKDYADDKCVHQLFEEQVEKSPAGVAVVFEDQQLTYRELNARANQLAHYLKKLGVGPEVRVGICVERSLEMVVALLGILKAGGAYVPLDPSYPKERLAFMIEDAQTPVVLTQKQLASRLLVPWPQRIFLDTNWEAIAQETAENFIGKANPKNPVYLLYTSGSTGIPKGVVMEHRALSNLISWQVQNFGCPIEARTLQFAPQSFDVSFQEIFSTWCSGGTLVLVSEEVRRDPSLLLQFLTAEEIERVFLPFIALQQLAEAAEGKTSVPTSLREIITAGEQLRMRQPIARLVERLKKCHLYNQYGPTESHVVTSFTVTRLPTDWPTLPPIGRPIPNTQLYVLDSHLRPVPIGVPGELCIAGAGLARGYLKRPELTAQKFIPNPFSNVSGARLYKTGDLARYLADGNIEFLGRLDDQVKIRGFRIELGEIESVLGQYPNVRESAVVVSEKIPGDKCLTAYVVPSDKQASVIGDLHLFLKEKLPDYMIPSAFVMLESLPLTPSGKLNRSALPALGKTRLDLKQAFVAPRTLVEYVLTDIWSEVLAIEHVGIYDNFFDLGGHSLLVTKVIAQIQRSLQVDPPVRSLFECPTIAQLATRIDAGQTGGVYLKKDEGNPSCWVKLQSGQSQTSLFCFPYIGGFRNDLFRFAKLARLVGPAYSFYGLLVRGSDGVSQPHRRIEDMVTEYIKEMKTLQPQGPYFLLGECFSGRVAYEIAQQLRDQGEHVAQLD